MPTTSEGWMNWRQASPGVFLPVSAQMPRAIISRTISSLAALVSVSTHLSDFTAITRPGYGPGMPGAAAGLYALTMRSFGSDSGEGDGEGEGEGSATGEAVTSFSAGASGAAASNLTNALRSMDTPGGNDLERS